MLGKSKCTCVASSNLSMLNTTCKMPDVEIHHILSISFLHWDSKWVKWVKREGYKSLSCGWNWTSQESGMYFKFEKSWISWIEPAEKRQDYYLSITSLDRHCVVETQLLQQLKCSSPLFDSYNHNSSKYYYNFNQPLLEPCIAIAKPTLLN